MTVSTTTVVAVLFSTMTVTYLCVGRKIPPPTAPVVIVNPTPVTNGGNANGNDYPFVDKNTGNTIPSFPIIPNTENVVTEQVINGVTDTQIIANVKSSNIDFSPTASGRSAGTWNWRGNSVPEIFVYIPTPANTREQDYAEKVEASITVINNKLKGLLVLKATNTPVVTNHIQISYNTSYVPAGFTDYKSGNYCANVSTAPYSGNPINPDWQNGIASWPVYVNLGNGRCEVTQDIIVHEFGHALGLANHFKGFGIGAAISQEYWDTLATLYNNPRSTASNKVVVKRISK